MKTEQAVYTTHDLAVGYRNGKTAVTLLQGLNLSLEKGKLVVFQLSEEDTYTYTHNHRW